LGAQGELWFRRNADPQIPPFLNHINAQESWSGAWQ